MNIKKYLTALVMAQSMFCSLPVPFHLWDEEARPYMLLFLPVVGLEIGLLWAVLGCLIGILRIPCLVYGLFMCAFPYLMTGFIHLDGFMDVADAVCSWRTLEQRRAILKDSHVGSFAVIWCIFLIFAGLVLFASSPDRSDTWKLILIPVISRCCSAFFVLRLKPVASSQYAQMDTLTEWHSDILIGIVVVCISMAFLCSGKTGLIYAAGLAGYIAALWRSYRSLEGMNGDVAGFCLTISELCAVAVYTLC